MPFAYVGRPECFNRAQQPEKLPKCGNLNTARRHMDRLSQETGDMVELKKSGLSNAIIAAMVAAQRP